MARFGVLLNWKNTLHLWQQLLNGGLDLSNLKSYEWEGEIAAGAEIGISHNLKQIPQRWFVTDAQNTNNLIRGQARWTSEYVYIKNQSSSQDFVGRIVFLP